jgi:hypothetical protein
MKTNQESGRTRTAKIGWAILLGMSALLILAGIGWYLSLPEMALENIAERTSLESDGFMVGKPSAFDIITLIARGYGAGFAILGLMALLIALEGYRNGTRWTWMVMWVLGLGYTAIAGIFLLAGETYVLSFGILGLAVITLVGLLLAGQNLALEIRDI